MKYFIYALQILFIGLKLANFIAWSWWLVLAPILFLLVCTIVKEILYFAWYRKLSPQEKLIVDLQRGKLPK